MSRTPHDPTDALAEAVCELAEAIRGLGVVLTEAGSQYLHLIEGEDEVTELDGRP